MLSDEEKEAIAYLNADVEYLQERLKNPNYIGRFITIQEVKYLKTILNLIEKQSKEIEELKEYKHDTELTKIACCTTQNCEALSNCIKLGRELQNADKKWKDKIKANIEEIDKKYEISKDEDGVSPYYYPDFTINILEELLEEE